LRAQESKLYATQEYLLWQNGGEKLQEKFYSLYVDEGLVNNVL
jgi:hypothetical protein